MNSEGFNTSFESDLLSGPGGRHGRVAGVVALFLARRLIGWRYRGEWWEVRRWVVGVGQRSGFGLAFELIMPSEMIMAADSEVSGALAQPANELAS